MPICDMRIQGHTVRILMNCFIIMCVHEANKRLPTSRVHTEEQVEQIFQTYDGSKNQRVHMLYTVAYT